MMLRCSVGVIRGGSRWVGASAVMSGLRKSGHTQLGCRGGIEDRAWRERGGRRGFFRSKSFKTGETLFLRNIKVPEMCAVNGGNEKIGF